MCQAEQKFPKLLIVCFFLFVLLAGCASPVDFSRVKNLYTATGTNLICFGNSLTSGMGAERGEDYPSILRRELPLPVINSGRSGDLTFTAVDRLERDVLEKDPKIVIVELGANDFLVYGSSGPPGKTTEDTFRNLEFIVENIGEHGAVVIVAGIPFNSEYKKGYERLAREKGAILISNIMKGIRGNPEFMSLDRTHPNAEGYKVMAEHFLKVLKPLLQEMEGI